MTPINRLFEEEILGHFYDLFITDSCELMTSDIKLSMSYLLPVCNRLTLLRFFTKLTNVYHIELRSPLKECDTVDKLLWNTLVDKIERFLGYYVRQLYDSELDCRSRHTIISIVDGFHQVYCFVVNTDDWTRNKTGPFNRMRLFSVVRHRFLRE